MDERGTIVDRMIAVLDADPVFNLVRAYQGEIDRYKKIAQLKEGLFIAEVNLTTPFALVVSKEREVLDNKSKSVKLKHNLSVYIGSANLHDIGNPAVPTIYTLLTKAVVALRPINNLFLVNEGIYLVKTDLFYIYDQQWYTNEILY